MLQRRVEDYKEEWRTTRRSGGLLGGVEKYKEDCRTKKRSGGLLGGLED